jgi:hypothetical protein
MREHEMRLRIESMLKKTAIPAGVGITMALAGCGSDNTTEWNPVKKYGAMMVGDSGATQTDATHQSATPIPLYMAQMPDAGLGDSAADATDATDDGASCPCPIYAAIIREPG